MEAKSRKKGKNKLTKTLHGQVLSHENWLRTHYGSVESQRVVIYPSNEAENNAGTHGTGVLTFAALNELVASTRSLLKLVGEAPEAQRASVAAQHLDALGLTPAAIIASLESFTDAAST